MLKFIFILFFIISFFNINMLQKKNRPWMLYGSMDCAVLDFVIDSYDKIVIKELSSKKPNVDLSYNILKEINSLYKMRKKYCIDL